MKRGLNLFFICILIFSILLIPLAFSQEDNETDSGGLDDSSRSDAKVDLAYNCLRDKVDERTCNSLSTEEKTFVAMSIGDCINELITESDNSKCWPNSGCKIKSTAQAILALKEAGSNTEEAEDWLIEHNVRPAEIIWYLQIESNEETTCTISYDSANYQVTIGADRKIRSGAGSCLSLSEGSWWLRVSPECYEKEFGISCNKGFLTTLLYKKQTSLTIYVSDKATSAPSEGTTTEKINSLCFGISSSCDYEGNLWAAMALKSQGHDVSAYLPYLITMADENEKFLPESFLYYLTGYPDYRNEILLKQTNGFWDLSGDKFYDTSVALYPFHYEDPVEKDNAKSWLLEVQGKDGCWQGNIRNTAFILNSVWSRNIPNVQPGGDLDCEIDGDGYCMSSVNCEGKILSGYDCAGAFACCDTPFELGTCIDQLGEICSSSETCVGGSIVYASDLSVGQTCCISGSCGEPAETSDCEYYGGECKSSGCNDDEEESSYECSYGDSCCVAKTDSGSSGSWWIWILIILIIVILVAIFFRNKLKFFWFRIKSKFSKNKGIPPSGRGLPNRLGFIPQRPRPTLSPGQAPRGIFPAQARLLQRLGPRPRVKGSRELDDVLKKLKDIGK